MYRAIAPANVCQQDRELKSKNKPTVCPWCGSQRIAIVIGGMPVYIPEMEEDLDNGESYNHDMPKGTNAPSWQCTECGAQFFRELQLINDQN